MDKEREVVAVVEEERGKRRKKEVELCYQVLFRGDVRLPSYLEVTVSMEDLGGVQSGCVLQQRRELYLHHSIQLHTKLSHPLFLLSDVMSTKEAMQEREGGTPIPLTSMQHGLVACCCDGS